MSQQQDPQRPPVSLTSEQQALTDLWEEHTHHEFFTKTYEGLWRRWLRMLVLTMFRS